VLIVDGTIFDRQQPDHLAVLRPLTWSGIVAIECVQQDGNLSFVELSNARDSLRHDDLVWVKSARRSELGGKRAICQQMPWGLVSRYFRTEDTDSVYVYAELHGGDGGHLEFYERASQREFFTVVESFHTPPPAMPIAVPLLTP